MAEKESFFQDDKTAWPSVESIAESLRTIDSMLSPDEDLVHLPLKELMALIPRRYAAQGAGELQDCRIPVHIDNLFYRLSRGKVAVETGQLAESLPDGLLIPEALTDTTEISIPLSIIVGAIPPATFRERMASGGRPKDVSAMPDHFPELKHALQGLRSPPPVAVEPAAISAPTVIPAPIVPLPAVIPEPVVHLPAPPVPQPPLAVEPAPPLAVEPASPLAVEPLPVPQAARVKPAPSRRRAEPAEDTPEGDYLEPESLGGVNLNASSATQLLTLDGVSAGLAEAIIAYRLTHGPFLSIFDLVNVPRLGRGTFRRIAGMPYSETRQHRRHKLARLLRLSPRDVGDLRLVAAGICGLSGVAGCLLSDPDGMLMAESGATSYAAPMSAVIPRMFRMVYENMAVASVGEVNSLSLCIKDRLYTIVSGARFCLTVVHQTNRLTRTQITTIQKLAAELDWLLSHRGYIGRAAT